jgi:hypothetical protein
LPCFRASMGVLRAPSDRRRFAGGKGVGGYPSRSDSPYTALMGHDLSRRAFCSLAAGLAAGTASPLLGKTLLLQDPGQGPVEAPFERDYPAPSFKPSWRRPQINRLLVQDFVIYAHSDLDMVAKLLAKEPALIHAAMDWGGGDWETALGAASHVGRRDLIELLLTQGARIDIFCAATLGQLEAVKAFLTLEPKLLQAKGAHGFTLQHHAKVGGPPALDVLRYLELLEG